MSGKQSKGQKIWEFLTSATPDQCRDTGLALVLICLLVAHFWHHPRFVPLALIFLILTMVWPKAFFPVAGAWFGLSHLLGTVVSKLILTLLFFALVWPIGSIRRLLGADPLQLKQWKKASSSVFQVRHGTISPQDLEKPY